MAWIKSFDKIAKPVIFMLSVTSIKITNYLLVLVNMVEKDKISGDESKNKKIKFYFSLINILSKL